MLAQGDIAALPRVDEPAWLLADSDKRAQVELAYETVAPMFWDARIPLDEACAVICGWSRVWSDCTRFAIDFYDRRVLPAEHGLLTAESSITSEAVSVQTVCAAVTHGELLETAAPTGAAVLVYSSRAAGPGVFGPSCEGPAVWVDRGARADGDFMGGLGGLD